MIRLRPREVLEAVNTIYQIYNRATGTVLRKGLKFINEQIPSVRKLVDQSEVNWNSFAKQ